MRKILLLCFLGWGIGALAQNTQSLHTALIHFQQKDSLYFSYDASLLELVELDFDYSTLSFEQFADILQAKRPFTISPIGENFYSVLSREVSFEVLISDQEDGQAIAPEFVNVLRNGMPLPVRRSLDKTFFDLKPVAGDSLQLFALGYDKQQISLEDIVNGRTIRASLKPTTIELPGLMVTDYITKGINLNPTSQSVDIAVSDMPLLPGETDGDLFASLSALPGISTPDNRPGNLVIRGSSTDQSLIMYDNIPIYHRGHYFGMISPYNPLMVDKVQTYRSGFHPRMGGRVGGAVDIKSSDDLSDEASAGIGTNTLYALGYAKAPLIKDKLGLGIGARRSYPYDFGSPKLSAISDAVFVASAVIGPDGDYPEHFSAEFGDYNAKIAFTPNDKQAITLTGIYASTEIMYNLDRPNMPSQGVAEKVGFENLGFNASWNVQMSRNWRTNLTTTYSIFDYKQFSGPVVPREELNLHGSLFANKINDFKAREEVEYEGDNFNLQMGLSYARQQLDYVSRVQDIDNPDDQTLIEDRMEGEFLTPFINLEFDSWKKFYVQTGIRATYFSQKSDFRIEPRLFANYEISNLFQLKASAGLYNQYMAQIKNLEFGIGGYDNELWILMSDEHAKIISGSQFMFGGLLATDGWVLDLEWYHKTATNIPYYRAIRLQEMPDPETALHSMYGVDLLVKKQLESASVWAGYSYGQVKVRMDTARTRVYDSKYSQPHSFNLGAAYQRKNLKLSLGWNYNSGQLVRSFDIIGKLRNARGNRPPGGGRPASRGEHPLLQGRGERYPNAHWLDLSASYQIPKTAKRPFKTTFGISIINLYNQENITDMVIRQEAERLVAHDRLAMSFAPNLMILLEL